MSSHIREVGDYELHAYADGELDPRRRVEVEAWLASHPQAMERVRDYERIRQALHSRFDHLLAGKPDLPPRSSRDRIGIGRAAATVLLMLAAGVSGWTLRGGGAAAPASQALADLVRPATFAHRVYSTDPRYPVEIPAIEKASLDRWVSQRMHTELQAPDLSHQGIRFIGGRLLPSTNRMAAQFMYEDGRGRRLTVYVRRIADPSVGTDFRYREQDGLNVFYWIDRSMGYALIGPQPASELIAIAHTVHATFTPGVQPSRRPGPAD